MTNAAIINALETAYNDGKPVTVGNATVKANPDASYASVRFEGSPVRLAISIAGKSVLTVDDTPTFGNAHVAPDIIAAADATDGATFYANIEAAFDALVA